MLKRTSIVLLLTVALVLATQPGHSVYGVVMTSEELATLNALDAAANSEKSKDDGNSFVRALKAPFKALSRLFGGGKKNDGKLERISEKDLKKFESIPSPVVTDARTVAKTAETSAAPVAVNGEIDYSAYVKRGSDLLNAGNFNGAIAELTKATALDAKSGVALNLLGIAYESAGMRDRALESFKRAVEADKKNAEYLNNYGFLLFKNRNLDDAMKYLKRATKVAPNDARVWNNLGLVQVDRAKFDDAFESFTHAGGEFNGHVNIANQLSARGFAQDAIKHLEKAQALQPNSTEVLAKLVDLYEMTGRARDAETARRSIVALRTFADVKK